MGKEIIQRGKPRNLISIDKSRFKPETSIKTLSMLITLFCYGITNFIL